MNRNTKRFSAFSIFAGAICLHNIALIALAFVYDCTLCLICSIILSAIIFQIHRSAGVGRRRPLQSHNAKKDAALKKQAIVQAGKPALEPKKIALNMQASSGEYKKQEGTPAQLLPGLPPICPN